VLHQRANAGLCRYFGTKGTRMPAFATATSVRDPYYGLGTHPDLVERLWDELGAALPVDCRAVFFGTPALIEPRTGIVFAFAGGTHTYGLRLPPREHADAVRAGAQRVHRYPDGTALALEAFGPEWVFGGWFADERAWCRAAYALAARRERAGPRRPRRRT
jgi:hypothetical protein